MQTRIVLGALRGGDDNAFKILNKFSTDADGLARPRSTGQDSPTFPRVRLGAPQSLVDNFRSFGPCGAGFGRRSLLAIFQFPNRQGGDRYDYRQRPVCGGPFGWRARPRRGAHRLGRLSCRFWCKRQSRGIFGVSTFGGCELGCWTLMIFSKATISTVRSSSSAFADI